MVRAHTGVGEQPIGGLMAHGNVQQTVSVKMAEFAACPLDEFNPAETVNFQANAGEAQCLKFQALHCR